MCDINVSPSINIRGKMLFLSLLKMDTVSYQLNYCTYALTHIHPQFGDNTSHFLYFFLIKGLSLEKITLCRVVQSK